MLLLGLPHAGGTSMAFRAFSEHLPQGTGLVAVDYPGHIRTRGTPKETVEALATLCLQHLPAQLFSRCVLFGHSLGGYVAHALAEGLAQRGQSPRALIVASTRPPCTKSSEATVATWDDQALYDWLMKMGGMPKVDNQATIYEMTKHIIRADLIAYQRYAPAPRILDLPALFVSGLEDPLCPHFVFHRWAEYLRRPLIRFVPSGHFGLQDSPQIWAECLFPALQELSTGGSSGREAGKNGLVK